MFFKVTDGNSLKTAFYLEALSDNDAIDFWDRYRVQNNFTGFMQRLELENTPNFKLKTLLRTDAVKQEANYEY